MPEGLNMEKEFNFIYITTNLINGKQYVGDHSCHDLEKDKYMGSGKCILKAIKKHKKENFNREILEFFDTRENAFELQEKYINDYNTLIPNGYNISPKGVHQISNSISQTTKEKMRIKKLGKKRKPFSKEHKNHIGLSSKNRNIGRVHTETSRNNMSVAHLGKSMSENTKNKLRKPHKIVVCPYCNKQGGIRAMHRYHFNNCKYYSSSSSF